MERARHLSLQPTPARPASRPTATSRWCAAAGTRRPSPWWPRPRRWWARLGRACYAPCEAECTRGSLEGPVSIRRLKRFVADTHYALPGARRRRAPAAERQARRRGRIRAGRPHRRLAAGASGLRGHASSRRRPRRAALPAWPSPPTACPPRWSSATSPTSRDLGVEIVTGTAGRRPRGTLRRRGSTRCWWPPGHRGRPGSRVPGEDLARRRPRRARLPARHQARSTPPDLSGKVRRRHRRRQRRHRRGPQRPTPRAPPRCIMVCLEQRDEMPAYAWEVDEALDEGVRAARRVGHRGVPRRGTGRGASSSSAAPRCSTQTGRFSPRYDETVRRRSGCDVVIVAIGMGADTAAFPAPLPGRGARAPGGPRAPCRPRCPGSSPPATR